MINDLDMQGWAYLLAPTFQFVNTAGKPLTEGYLEVYIAGTRNKYYCASDFDGTLHPFQIPLDSLGSNIVLADPSQAYDVYVYNRFGSLVMSRYNVSPSNAGGSGVLTITISSNDDTVQVVHDGNNYDLSIADTIARIDDIEDRLDEIGDGSVGYAIAHSELASGGLFDLTNDKNKDLDYTGDMRGFRLKPGHVYQLNFNAKFDCNNDTNDLISGKFYLDGDNVVAQEWQFNVDNSFEHQESFNGSTVLVIPEDVSYYDVKLKYSFDDEALDLYLNKISIVDVTSIVSQGASGGGVEYTDGDGIIIDNSNHTINVDMDYINSHLDIDASSILSSAYNYTDARVSQASGDIVNIISEVTGSLPIPEQVQSDWNQDDDTQVDYIKNKPDLDIYATHDEVTNLVSSVSSVLQSEIDNIPTQVQSDWEEDNTSSPSYIQHKPEVEEVTFEEINLDDYALASAIPDISNLATKDELNVASGNIINYVDNSIDNVTNVIESVSGDLQEQINNIPEQVQSNWTEDNTSDPSYILNKPNELELVAGENIAIFVSGGTITISASSPDLSDYATHNEVYNSSVSAINSANSYTDTAIANLDLTPAVEIVSPNNTISVSSVVNSANNTKTFYIDTNDPDTNYWLGEANLTLSDQSSQGQVGYYKEVFDYTTKLNGNLDETKLKKGLYLLTANVMVVADEVNNDIAEIQIVSTSTSAISNTSSVFQHDCSVEDTLGEPMDESHQIATIVRVMYDDTPMSLIARMDDPTTVSNELHLWFSDICLYELKGTSAGGSTTPGASGSYDAGWGIVINGNVISVNQSIIPDVSNFATETYVNNRIASAVNIVESEIPDVSNLATRNELNTASGNIINYVNDQIGDIPTQVQSDWAVTNIQDLAYIKNKPSESQLIPGANISITASGSDYVISSSGEFTQVQSDWNQTDNTQVDYIKNKPSLEGLATIAQVSSVSSVLQDEIDNIPAQVNADWESNSGKSEILNKPDLSIYATITQVGEVSGNIISQIPDVSNLATKTEVNTASATLNNKIDTVSGAIPTLPQEEEVEFEEIDLSNYALASAIPDVSNLATKAEVSAATGDLQSQINNLPSQVQSDWTESDDSDPSYILNKPEEINLVGGNNITITVSGSSAIINGQAGGGTTYTAGDGIDITNDTISVDNTVALKSDLPNAVSGASGVKVEDDVISLDNPVGLVAGENITITVSGSSAIISGQAGGGSSYTAGTGIDITNNVISVTDPNKVFIAEYGTTTWNDLLAAFNSGKAIYCKFTSSTHVGVDGTSYGTSILPMVEYQPAVEFRFVGHIRYASGQAMVPNWSDKYAIVSLNWYPAGWTNTLTDYDPLQVQSNWNETSSSSKAYIQNKPDVSTLATKSEVQSVSAAIPDTSDMATQTWVGNQGYLTSIPATYVTDTELASAVSGLATKNELTTGLNTKQDTLTGITDVQVVQSLPASPVATVLYLIPEV